MTVSSGLFWLLTILLGAKVSATVALVAMGDYRAPRLSAPRRAVAFVSKGTPILIILTAFSSACLSRNREHIWIYGGLVIVVPLSIVLVNKLRDIGRFYGVADVLSRYISRDGRHS